MNDLLIGGEPAALIREAFRSMMARRQGEAWVSGTGRLDPESGEVLARALQAVAAELPRRLGSTREQHRAAALDEIARQIEAPVDHAVDRAREAGSAKAKRVGKARAGKRTDRAEAVQAQLRADRAEADEVLVWATEAIDRVFGAARPRDRGARHLVAVSPGDQG